MPIVGDFTVIRGDDPILIGDARPVWEEHFDTGGRHVSGAILVLSVRGLTDAVVSVPVKINDREVGRIQPYSLPGGRANPASEAHWYTQMIAFDASVLSARAGLTNKLEVEAVHLPRVRRREPARRLHAQGCRLLSSIRMSETRKASLRLAPVGMTRANRGRGADPPGRPMPREAINLAFRPGSWKPRFQRRVERPRV